jgi:hypothetical protein
MDTISPDGQPQSSPPLSEPAPRRSTRVNNQKRTLDGAEDSAQPAQPKKKSRSKAAAATNNQSKSAVTAPASSKPATKKAKKKVANDALVIPAPNQAPAPSAPDLLQAPPSQVGSRILLAAPEPSSLPIAATTPLSVDSPVVNPTPCNTAPTAKKQSKRKKNNSEIAQKGMIIFTNPVLLLMFLHMRASTVQTQESESTYERYYMHITV